MNIAITGASGMLGTALIDKLSNVFLIFATARDQGLVKNNVTWQCFDFCVSDPLRSTTKNPALLTRVAKQ